MEYTRTVTIYLCTCSTCGKEFEKEGHGSLVECVRCAARRRLAEWRKLHPDYKRYQPSPESKLKYAQSERGLQKGREKTARYWEKRGVEAQRAYNRAQYAKHRKKFIQKVTKRHIQMQRSPWANQDAIEAIYAEARRLTKKTGIPHEVDHVVPMFGKNVCGFHVEYNLKILTRRANRAKARMQDDRVQ